MKLFWPICILQCSILLVLYFGDIGFDKPGRFGLAFDHLLILMLLFAASLVAATIIVFRARRWRYLSIQFILFVLAALAIATN